MEVWEVQIEKLHTENPYSKAVSPVPPSPLPCFPSKSDLSLWLYSEWNQHSPVLFTQSEPSVKSLPQPGTHSVVLSPPSCSGGGQERVSSKRGVSGKEAGEDVGKERGLEAAATGHSMSSAVKLFCDLPLPGVPSEGICRALAPLCPAT